MYKPLINALLKIGVGVTALFLALLFVVFAIGMATAMGVATGIAILT